MPHKRAPASRRSPSTASDAPPSDAPSLPAPSQRLTRKRTLVSESEGDNNIVQLSPSPKKARNASPGSPVFESPTSQQSAREASPASPICESPILPDRSFSNKRRAASPDVMDTTPPRRKKARQVSPGSPVFIDLPPVTITASRPLRSLGKALKFGSIAPDSASHDDDMNTQVNLEAPLEVVREKRISRPSAKVAYMADAHSDAALPKVEHKSKSTSRSPAKMATASTKGKGRQIEVEDPPSPLLNEMVSAPSSPQPSPPRSRKQTASTKGKGRQIEVEDPPSPLLNEMVSAPSSPQPSPPRSRKQTRKEKGRKFISASVVASTDDEGTPPLKPLYSMKPLTTRTGETKAHGVSPLPASKLGMKPPSSQKTRKPVIQKSDGEESESEPLAKRKVTHSNKYQKAGNSSPIIINISSGSETVPMPASQKKIPNKKVIQPSGNERSNFNPKSTIDVKHLRQRPSHQQLTPGSHKTPLRVPEGGPSPMRSRGLDSDIGSDVSSADGLPKYPISSQKKISTPKNAPLSSSGKRADNLVKSNSRSTPIRSPSWDTDAFKNSETPKPKASKRVDTDAKRRVDTQHAETVTLAAEVSETEKADKPALQPFELFPYSAKDQTAESFMMDLDFTRNTLDGDTACSLSSATDFVSFGPFVNLSRAPVAAVEATFRGLSIPGTKLPVVALLTGSVVWCNLVTPKPPYQEGAATTKCIAVMPFGEEYAQYMAYIGHKLGSQVMHGPIYDGSYLVFSTSKSDRVETSTSSAPSTPQRPSRFMTKRVVNAPAAWYSIPFPHTLPFTEQGKFFPLQTVLSLSSFA
ncbi:hypothetical protein GALMADRAFT_148018 [Galerina marginata CBS 339.88]|uniref:Uncharacterized protein n=1 Tax=Galerina marginata (strain CBS 339.88) TaxID=685588 RepID=A0A067S8K9_GALM3|nr:hypothetical protein GALMADRAFT_148018 [Galerina marginata CBS 339.88]